MVQFWGLCVFIQYYLCEWNKVPRQGFVLAMLLDLIATAKVFINYQSIYKVFVNYLISE